MERNELLLSLGHGTREGRDRALADDGHHCDDAIQAEVADLGVRRLEASAQRRQGQVQGNLQLVLWDLSQAGSEELQDVR